MTLVDSYAWSPFKLTVESADHMIDDAPDIFAIEARKDEVYGFLVELGERPPDYVRTFPRKWVGRYRGVWIVINDALSSPRTVRL